MRKWTTISLAGLMLILVSCGGRTNPPVASPARPPSASPAPPPAAGPSVPPTQKTTTSRYIPEAQALATAQRHDPQATWQARLAEDYVYAGKAGKQTRPAWLVTATYPMGNRTVVMVDAVSGGEFGVLQAEGPGWPGPPARPGCGKGAPERLPPEPVGPASPVQARVFVKDDPGIAAPIMALVAQLPITIVVQFNQPVDPGSFALAATDNRCDYAAGPIDQDTRWQTDRLAEITVRELPPGKPGPYGVTFGGGKDPQGREVRELRFGFMVQQGRPLQVLAVPVAGGTPQLIFDRNLHLEMRSISPDGRYVLLIRRIWANANTHSTVHIPYVADLKTGGLRAYSRGDVSGWRWDLPGQALWVSGWQRLDLGGDADTGQTLLDRLPPGDGFLLGARVSPDGKWLAAVRTTKNNEATGKADLIVVDLDSGQPRTQPAAIGYLDPPNGPAKADLQWLPDSSQLLVESYRRGASPDQGTAEPVLVDPRTLELKALPVPAGENRRVFFSPGGNYLVVGQYGILTLAGREVVRDPSLWNGVWSPNDRFLLLGSGSDFTILEIATGKRTPLKLPPVAGPGYLYPLGFSADGSVVYVARL